MNRMAETARKIVNHSNIGKQTTAQIDPLDVQKKKFKRRERLAVCVLLGWAALLGCVTISSSIHVNTAQSDLQAVTTQVTKLNSKNSNIRQEISELSSRSRLMGIAKKNGLSLNEQNTRNVTK